MHRLVRGLCYAGTLAAGLWMIQSAHAQLEPGSYPPGSIVENEALLGAGDYAEGDAIQPEADWGMMGADCGYSCPPAWYIEGDVLWLSREHEDGPLLSRDIELGDFDFRQFYRVTLGHTNDCLDGWEMSYVGGGRWRETATLTGTDLDSFIVAGSGFTSLDFTAFNNAQFHSQNYESELHSFEVNRRWWGWDVFSVKAGARVMHLEEEFLFFSQQGGGDQGILLVETQNDLILWQLGMDLMRPYGRLTTGAKLVGGIGLNFNDGDALVANAGDVKINTGDDSEEFAFFVETGVYSIYRLTERISLHAGYEGWFLGELALANEQVNGPIDIFFGRAYDETDELFIHGAHAGVEFVW